MAEEKKQQKEHGAKKEISKEHLPEIKPGMTIRVYQKITEMGSKGEKERVKIFEGIIIALKGGKRHEATITVRKISEGIGVEKIFPLNSHTIVKIEPVKQAKVKRAKLYYLQNYKKRLKENKIEK